MSVRHVLTALSGAFWFFYADPTALELVKRSPDFPTLEQCNAGRAFVTGELEKAKDTTTARAQAHVSQCFGQ